jgi:hypothetical protein
VRRLAAVLWRGNQPIWWTADKISNVHLHPRMGSAHPCGMESCQGSRDSTNYKLIHRNRIKEKSYAIR